MLNDEKSNPSPLMREHAYRYVQIRQRKNNSQQCNRPQTPGSRSVETLAELPYFVMINYINGSCIFEAGEDLLNESKTQVLIFRGTTKTIDLSSVRPLASYCYEFCGMSGSLLPNAALSEHGPRREVGDQHFGLGSFDRRSQG